MLFFSFFTYTVRKSDEPYRDIIYTGLFSKFLIELVFPSELEWLAVSRFTDRDLLLRLLSLKFLTGTLLNVPLLN